MSDQREYNARYYQKNKKKLKKYARDYGNKNSEKRKERAAKWRGENPERVKATSDKWYALRQADPAYKARKLVNQRKRHSTPEERAKRRALIKERRKKFPERAREIGRNAHYRSKYGITVAERDELFEKQGKCCRICRSDSSSGRGFHVDHCHTTKQIRGILCHHCNLMLGNSQENIATLEAAIAYLKGNK